MIGPSTARVAAVACAVALAGVVAGCGVGWAPEARRSTSRPTAGSQVRVVSGAQLARELSAAAVESGTVHVKAQVAGRDDGIGPMTAATGVVRLTAPVVASFRFPVGRRAGRLIIVDGVGYLRGMPTGVRGKPWLRLDAATLEWLGSSSAVLDLATDDVTGLKPLGEDLSFTDSGASTLPGARQYTAHLTTEEWVATFGGPTREQAREWAADQGVTGATILLFVSDDGLPVKQIFTLLPNSVQVTTQVEFLQWGEPVSITAPPRRNVVRCADTPACMAVRTA
jgi:hypothetical protein